MSGGDGRDYIVGNQGDDVLAGDNERDLIFAGRGNDRLTGGEGRDRLHGGDGNDQTDGGPGRDLISGGQGDDVSRGGDGNDRIFANLGVDESFGGNGDDDLWALARGDVSGPADVVGDTLHGEAGSDTFHTRDGEVDKIDCGDGNDRALLDSVDVIVDATPANQNGSCEQVEREDPKTKDDQSENSTQNQSGDNDHK
jgi:Ca2+-binding RTX toxin-like protein